MKTEVLADAIKTELVDDHAAARRRIDDAEEIERLGGFADDRMAHAEALDHLVLGRQRVAGLETVVDDVLAELYGQLFAEPLTANLVLGRWRCGHCAT